MYGVRKGSKVEDEGVERMSRMISVDGLVHGCQRISEENEKYKNCYHEVVAWMPLPEPYREVTDEENLESRR